MKNLLNKLINTKIVQMLIKNTLTQISVLGFIMIVSAILSNYYDWAHYTMVGSMFLLALIAVTYIIFAWIVNPIRELINKIKEKKKKND